MRTSAYRVTDRDEGVIQDDGPIISLQGITKSFPGVRALDGVSLQIAPGEIHALVGENGAGKSTLVNIIAGTERPDDGHIAVHGRTLSRYDERMASRFGISVVHQERSLAPNLSVAENVFSGHPPVHFKCVIDKRASNRQATELLRPLLASFIRPTARAGDLSSAEQQLVEIAKSLSREIKLLVLDEPTAALTIAETQHLFSVVRELADRGVGVLFISHRLHEVFEVAQRVTVVRDGKVTASTLVDEVDESALIRFMIGRELVEQKLSRMTAGAAAPILNVSHLSSRPLVKDVSFAVRPGEIVCLAGLVGAGRSEVCETIFGYRPKHGGTIEFAGSLRERMTPSEAMTLGIGFVPEDRKDGGLFLDLSVRDNIMSTNLQSVAGFGVIRLKTAEELANRFVEELRITTPSCYQPVGNLSGGNQQKVLLAKWLARRLRLLVVDEPTRGVDVGARADIYRILRGLADEGTAILAVSSDLPEVLTIADRIVVLAEGISTGELDSESTETEILELATPRAQRNA